MWCDCSCGRLLTLTTQSDKSGLRTTHTHTVHNKLEQVPKGCNMENTCQEKWKTRSDSGWAGGGASVCDWPNAVVIVRKFEHIWQSAKVNRTRGWMGGRLYGSCQQAAGEKWAEPTTENNSLLSDKAIRSKMGFCIWNTVAVTSWQSQIHLGYNSSGGRCRGRKFVYTKRISDALFKFRQWQARDWRATMGEWWVGGVALP